MSASADQALPQLSPELQTAWDQFEMKFNSLVDSNPQQAEDMLTFTEQSFSYLQQVLAPEVQKQLNMIDDQDIDYEGRSRRDPKNHAKRLAADSVHKMNEPHLNNLLEFLSWQPMPKMDHDVDKKQQISELQKNIRERVESLKHFMSKTNMMEGEFTGQESRSRYGSVCMTKVLELALSENISSMSDDQKLDTLKEIIELATSECKEKERDERHQRADLDRKREEEMRGKEAAATAASQVEGSSAGVSTSAVSQSVSRATSGPSGPRPPPPGSGEGKT
jgi:hypothetical protein